MLSRTDASWFVTPGAMLDVDDQALNFYALILPHDGWYVLQVLRGTTFLKPQFFDNTEDFWRTAKRLDIQGFTVYHAMASFREALCDQNDVVPSARRYGRTQHNVQWLSTFWLDVDVGPDKDYKSLDDALGALQTFCTAYALPLPLLVFSGYGLHCYWPLAVSITLHVWREYAHGLKRLCKEFGLHADHGKTADAVCVLRPPGTHNRKQRRSAPQVQVSKGITTYEPDPLERFDIFRQAGNALPTKTPVVGLSFANASASSALPYLANGHAISTDLLRNNGPASYADAVAHKCAQVRSLRDWRNVPEFKGWHKILGAISHCADGDAKAHAWCSGHPAYNHDDVQAKLERWRQYGPATCAVLHDANPETCSTCPFYGRITAPVVLGRADPTGLIPMPQVQSAAAPAEVVQPLRTQLAQSRAWECTTKGTLKTGSYLNARLALLKLGVSFSYDVFHLRSYVHGAEHLLGSLGNELSDSILRALRDVILVQYGFDPGLALMDAIQACCDENPFDPVAEWLDDCQAGWDGIPRLGTWMVRYLGADNTPFNHAAGLIHMMAGVRRVRDPGCKYDQILVLEGPENLGKSSAIAALARHREDFTDEKLLGLDSQRVQELLRGKHLSELAELTGVRKAEVEHVKAFASRTTDRCRPAYGRFVTEQPRRCIIWATTNDKQYLQSQTGNRRFWPVEIKAVDLGALRRDREQLWGEAATLEASGAALTLSPALYNDAKILQLERVSRDAWEDILMNINLNQHVSTNNNGQPEWRISTLDIYDHYLRLTPDKRTDFTSKRIANIMRSLGWQGPSAIRIKNATVNGYTRPIPGGQT